MEETPETNKNMTVVGINLGVLIFYTILFRISLGTDGVILLALAIAAHFILCLLLAAIPNYGKAFLLSSLAVLLIGFSTCYLAYAVH